MQRFTCGLGVPGEGGSRVYKVWVGPVGGSRLRVCSSRLLAACRFGSFEKLVSLACRIIEHFAPTHPIVHRIAPPGEGKTRNAMAFCEVYTECGSRRPEPPLTLQRFAATPQTSCSRAKVLKLGFWACWVWPRFGCGREALVAKSWFSQRVGGCGQREDG